MPKPLHTHKHRDPGVQHKFVYFQWRTLESNISTILHLCEQTFYKVPKGLENKDK